MSAASTASDNRTREDPPRIDLVIGPNRDADNRQFGRLLASWREAAGLSRADAAVALDMSAEYIRLIELGRRTPAIGQMPALLKLYSIAGELDRLQPGGDRPNLIAFPPGADEPLTIDFVNRIREPRRRGRSDAPLHNERVNVERQIPEESRAATIGRIVTLLVRADEATLRKAYNLIEKAARQSTSR